MQSTFIKMNTFSTVSLANYFVCVSFHLRGEILIITIYLYCYYNGSRIQITVYTYFF